MTRLPLTRFIFEISSVAHHNSHINAILVYLFIQELFVNKIHFFKFFSMSDKPRLHQLKIITSSRSAVQPSLTSWMFSSVRENTVKEGEIPYVENKYKASPTYLARWNFLFHSLTCISQIFVSNLPRWSKPRYHKAEVCWVTQKVQTVLVRYLLLGIRMLVYSCRGCRTSKIYLCLEDSRSSFSWVSLKSKTKDTRP